VYPLAMEQGKSERVVTITVSDTRTEADDESGSLLGELLKEAGFPVRRHHIIRDEPDYIRELVIQTSRSDAEAIILTGGTGMAPRDQTYEVIDALLEKRMDGFGEAFRRLSWEEVGPRSVLSRATAGTLNGTLIFSLPGSVRAVRLGVEKIIVPILGHAMDIAAGRTAHPPHGATT
jgi:molybdenum cofactor biosynthesis protein B